jgi:hypothetical protein
MGGSRSRRVDRVGADRCVGPTTWIISRTGLGAVLRNKNTVGWYKVITLKKLQQIIHVYIRWVEGGYAAHNAQCGQAFF